MIYLIEIDAHDSAAAGVVTLRYGTSGYTSEPDDDPANIHFEERVMQPGNYERHAFSEGRTHGDAEVGFGEIVLANPDGVLDGLIDHGIDGRRLTIYGLESETSAWAERTCIFTGTMEQPEPSWTRMTIRIRDRQEDLRNPLQTETYAGTTSEGGLDEAEGTEDDLKDRFKPLLFGVGRNIPAILANRFDLVYQVSSGALSAISDVRDRGASLTAAGDHASLSVLLAATLASGEYATCLAGGYVRLGGAPVGAITVDAMEGASGKRTVAQTVARILIMAGFVEGTDWLQADIDALDLVNDAEVGIWLDAQEHTILATCSALLNSIGAYMAPDRLGVFRIGAFREPSGEPVVEIDANIALDRGAGIERLSMRDEGNGVPASKVTVRWGRNWLVQDADAIDGTVASEAVQAFAVEEWRTAVARDATVKTKHLHASEPSFDSYLAVATDAEAEAARRLDLYKVRRDRFRVLAKADQVTAADIGKTVRLTLDRYGLEAGKLFTVLGIMENLADGVTTLDIWG